MMEVEHEQQQQNMQQGEEEEAEVRLLVNMYQSSHHSRVYAILFGKRLFLVEAWFDAPFFLDLDNLEGYIAVIIQ